MVGERVIFYSSSTAPASLPAAETTEPIDWRTLMTITRPRVIALTSALLALAAAGANAQAVRTERNVSLELANQIAAGAVSACAANGYAVAATVVDRAGTVRAVQRA